MKKAASLLPGDPEFGDLEISRAAILSIAQTYARDLKKYEVALKHYEQLRRILIQLKSSKVHLAENRLDVALSKMECHHLFSFEEQKDAFEKVEMPKDDIVLYVKYLEGYIDFLNGHKNREGVLDILNDLNSELLKYSSFQSDSQEDPPTTSSQDQFDLLSDKEIFQKVKDYYKVEEEVEEKKRKIKLKNKHGENLLHEAAKESLKKVKFLIERCGYKLVINEKDNSNWTPLSEAVSHGHLDIVEYLIEHGAEMNTISKEALVDEDDKDC
uniref:Uncharacterized protein n=1 Tax=Panagrolaimus sp. ES5 TaxID=591445 RepID=A0AC34FRL4_9BILA